MYNFTYNSLITMNKAVLQVPCHVRFQMRVEPRGQVRSPAERKLFIFYVISVLSPYFMNLSITLPKGTCLGMIVTLLHLCN